MEWLINCVNPHKGSHILFTFSWQQLQSIANIDKQIGVYFYGQWDDFCWHTYSLSNPACSLTRPVCEAVLK